MQPAALGRAEAIAVYDMRIDRIGLELRMKGGREFHIEEDDPLSAAVELRRGPDHVTG